MNIITPVVARRSSKVIVLGCYPPRQCGIATFTQDTVEALLAEDMHMAVSVVAMDDGSNLDELGGPVIQSIKQHHLAGYVEAAATINELNPDCLIIQHEFGIFGGAAGEYLLTLLALVKVPVITIFHTILQQPDENQLRVMRRLVDRSARLVVMAQRGAALLREVYEAAPDKIAVIPHGAPVRKYAEPSAIREKLGITCEHMLSTFGLLSPNKGIENVIRAMPEVLAKFPSTQYFILGVTHPHLLAREGEAYRHSLEALAESLSVSANIQFINRFVENSELLDFLQASDVYVTPYLNHAQITSGTLSYALAMGCYVVSSPYWHAQEALNQCPGSLVPDLAEGMGEALLEQFENPEGLAASRREIYQWAELTHWPEFGKRLLGLVGQTTGSGNRISQLSDLRGPAFPATALKAITRMTDECGILQHSRFGIPDRSHGYCVDDNARGLILCNTLIRQGKFGADVEHLHSVYASFVAHSFETDSGKFRNFMDYGRNWMEGEPSEDSQGRAFWALGHAAATYQYSGNSGWAATLVQESIDSAERITSPRARALVVLGCAELMQSEDACSRYADLMIRFAENLSDQLGAVRCKGWDWLEETLSYDNGRIPQALLAAARISGSTRIANSALSSLSWLCNIQLIDRGMFAPVGSESFGRVQQRPLPYDQQPIEAAAMLDACLEAYKLTQDKIWWRRGKTVFSWFFGLNSHDLPLADPVTGHCHDGLNRAGLNLNAGAESLLGFQMSVCTYQTFLELVDSTSPHEELARSRQALKV